MRLTWRDTVATVLVAAVVGMYWAYLADVGLPLVTGPRALAATAVVVGLFACAIGGGNAIVDRDPITRGISAFAVVPGFAAVIAIVTGSGIALAVLVGGIVAMWAATTLRHALTRPPTAVDGDAHRSVERDALSRR